MRGRFGSLVGGELRKLVRTRANWPLVLVPALVVLLPAMLSGSGGRPFAGPDDLAERVLDPLTVALQVGVGIPLLVLAARTIGQEYQLGTIRVLIARGAGRVRLLLAKLAALTLVAAAGAAGAALLGGGALGLAQPSAVAALQPAVGRDAGLNLLAIGLSLAACVLLGAFTSALGRSVVFGLAVALVWLPFENLAAIALTALSTVTGRDAYGQLTAYLLAPNLNVMVHATEPWRRSPVFFAAPGLPVDGSHSLLVAGAYLGGFLAASLLLTWRRDVSQ